MASVKNQRIFLLHLALLSMIVLGGTLFFAFKFCQGVSSYWFNPAWTTDDAFQQLFPFLQVLHPENFKGDLIFETMKGYLAPIHWWLGVALTYVTGDVIMTGHWMMLIQLGLTLFFLGGALFAACKGEIHERGWALIGLVPALISVFWFLHSRLLVQRMTAGLPRGWGPVLFTAYLFFVLRGRHRAIVGVILAGALLNPPAAFLVGFAYGCHLLTLLTTQRERVEGIPALIQLIVATPILLGAVFYATHRPAEVGSIATYEQALQMPEFQKAGGRFSFVPFDPIEKEFTNHAFRVFMGKIHNIPATLKRIIPWCVCGGIFLLLFLGARLKRELIPLPILTFGIATLVVYLLSRQFAFRLYVPDRHLTYPMGIFFISAYCAGIWRLFVPTLVAGTHLRLIGAVIAFGALGGFVYAGLGNGLQPGRKGTANFNFYRGQRGGVFVWIRDNTPPTSLFAGHPTHIDPLPLFGQRKAFATSETWQPFYKGYSDEMRRRLEIAYRLHYALDPESLVKMARDSGIDYVVFARAQFYPEALAKAGYFEPLNALVHDLASKDPQAYVFRRLVKSGEGVVYQDKQSLVVSISKLEEALNAPKK